MSQSGVVDGASDIGIVSDPTTTLPYSSLQNTIPNYWYMIDGIRHGRLKYDDILTTYLVSSLVSDRPLSVRTSTSLTLSNNIAAAEAAECTRVVCLD
jgi:hypothetical protein